MTVLKKGSLNKFGEKVIGDTLAYSQRWNVVELTAPKLREKLIGRLVAYKYKTIGSERVNKIVNIGRLEYSPYLMLEVEPNQDQIREHNATREAIKNEMGVELNPRPQNVFIVLTDNENIYEYIIMDQEYDLMAIAWLELGEKIYV
jgi:hypothetical protein